MRSESANLGFTHIPPIPLLHFFPRLCLDSLGLRSSYGTSWRLADRESKILVVVLLSLQVHVALLIGLRGGEKPFDG